MPICSCISTFKDINHNLSLIVNILLRQTLIHTFSVFQTQNVVPSSLHLCIFTHAPFFLTSLSLGHKHRQKRHKLKRRSVSGVTTVPSAAPVVSAGIFSDLESLSASLASDALLRSESDASGRPSNDSSGDSGPHRRSKRFLSYPRFVEVMLVADSKMVEHHGSNLQHYILTLMSIVSSALSNSFMATR